MRSRGIGAHARVWIALAALCLAPAETPAQERTFREDLVVTAVEVPVQVLRAGQPVRGLTAADFEIYDRGKRQEIVGFEVLDLSRVATGTAPAPEPPVGSEAAPASPTRVRHFLLLFDFEFSRPHLLMRALQGARRMLAEQLAPSDRAAVALYTGIGGVRLLTGFTTDRESSTLGLDFLDAVADRDRKRQKQLAPQLQALWGGTDEPSAEALKRLSRQVGLSAALALTGGGLPEVMGIAEYDRLIGGGQVGADEGSLLQSLSSPTFIDPRAVELETGLHALATWAEAVGELATLLRDVPDPKNLLLFSEGFATELLDNRETQGRAVAWIEPVIDSLQAAGWALQAIDVEGIPDPLAGVGRGAVAETDPAGSQLVTGGARGQVRAPVDLVGFDAQALFHLADSTGGQVVENYNDLAAATAVTLERISVTYLLAFQPRDLVADGARHDIEVRLRKDLESARILHRRSYRAPKPLAERSPLELTLDAAGVVSGDRSVRDLEASVLVLPLPLSGERRRTPVVIEIPGGELARGRREGSAEIELRAYGVAADESLSDLLVQQVKLDLAKLGERLEAGGLRYFGSLALPAGEQAVRVVVRDLSGGGAFLETRRVRLGALNDAAPVLLPPVFLDSSGNFLALRQAADAGAEGSDPFAVGTGAVAPSVEPAIAGGGEPTVLAFVYPGPGEAADLESRVRSADGAVMEGAEVVWLERLADLADGGQRVVGRLATLGLEPGAYQLELRFADPRHESVASAPFTVLPSEARSIR